MSLRRLPSVIPGLLAAMAVACSGGSDGSDAGPDAGHDAGRDAAGPDRDKGDGDGTALPDEDLGDDYGLFVPAGFQACTIPGYVWPDMVADTLTQLGRVTFKPGLHRLPGDQATFVADLIEQVEWNREPRVGVPADPGTFTRSGDLFTYTQDVQLGADLMRLEMRIDFSGAGQVVELSEQNFLDYRVSLGAAVDANSLYLIACSHASFGCGVTDYTLEGGDSVSIEVCSICTGLCKSSLAFVPRAEVTLSGQHRVVDDGMQLAIRFGQHDWYGNALVYLRDPLAGTAGLVIAFGNLLEGQTAHLFDESLQVTATRAITATGHRAGW